MKNTPFRSAHSLLSARRIADSRILVIVLLAMMFTCEAEAANSGSATQTISEDGLISTWSNLTFTIDANSSFDTEKGLYFTTTTSSISNNLKEGSTMYVQVPSKDAKGHLYIYSSATSNRTVKLNSGTTISQTKPNSETELKSADIVNVNDKWYIQITHLSGEFKFTSVKVTLTNGNYKEETPTCTPPGLAFSEASCTVPLGETFTSPSLTNSYNLSISYSSSDPNVATIDTEGKVTILDAGQTTITAISEADETYCAGEASYILTVTSPQCAAPNISKQPTSVEISVGETATLSIEATGDNLAYQWYTCDQDGNNETAIDGATTTIYEAIPTEAGTTYYKVIVTGACESVSSDIVSITAKEIVDTGCEAYVYYHVAPDGKENSDRFTFSETLKGNNTINNKMTIDDTEYTCNSRSSSTTASFTFTVTDGKKADLYMCVCGGGGTRFMKAVSDKGDEKSISINNHVNEDKTYKTFTLTDLGSGTWTITCYEKETDTAGKSWYLSMLGLHECRTKPAAPISYAETSFSSPFSNKPNTPQEIIIGAEETAIATIKELITYTSSNPDVATIDAATGEVTYKMLGTTTITATFEGNDKYASSSASYTLHVVAPAGKEFSATLSADNLSVGCNNATLSVAIEPDNASVSQYQWYSCDADGSNETLIKDAIEATYITGVAGTYKVLVTANGYPQQTNTLTITKEEPKSVGITRLTPFHHYRKGCDYAGSNDHPVRHLFLVDSKELTLSESEKAYSVRLSKRNGGTSESVSISMNADNPWLYESKDTIMLDLQKLHNAGYDEHVEEGDTLHITIVPLNACGDYDESQASNIDITVVGKDQRALAFIVAGCDPTSATPYEPVLGGDFFADINKRNLWLRTGKDTWDENTDGVLWGGLRASDTFIPTAVNGYAEFDIFNYEPFDIIMLSDYVRTNATGNAGYAYFDKLAQLVDYRPILSLKSHMSRPELTSWRAKGFLADPISLTGKTNMTVLCLGHTILNDVSPDYFNKDDGELKVLTAVGYEGNKGLQGFQSRDLIGFVNIGYVIGDNSEPLIACCERQNVLHARLMVLSINSEATPMLTEGGIEAIRAMLYYLMKTDETDIEDCSNQFLNTTGDEKWSTPGNWSYGHLPLLASNVQILANCKVDLLNAAAGAVKIQDNVTLTINADASLRVAKRMGEKVSNLQMKPLSATDYSTITIKADANGSGTLIHSASEGWEIPATVEYYSIASGAPDNCNYQWMASPVQNIPQAEVPFAGAWVYGWDKETHTWGNYLRNGDSMTAFDAYCFTQRTGDKNTYTIQGKLVNIQTETAVPLSYNEALPEARKGINVTGNSWTAPINISGWTEADFKNCEASIILFNTGFDPTGTGAQIGNGTDLAGQYSTIPVNTASNMDLRYQVIPAMQAFQVNATGAGAQLTMNYDRLVRTDHVNRQPMHIQGRRNAESTESTGNEGITATLRIRIKGERYSDQVYIFRHADCTNGYENGWDGRKILGAAAALQLFVESAGERYAVSTQPELAGTRLAFFKGEDDTYTMEFDYDGEETLYLYDSNTDRYTPVFTGSTYFFRSETTKPEHRFLLTDNRPEEPSGPTTGVVEVDIEDNSLILSNTTQDPVTLSIFDAAGRLCYRQTLHTPLATIPVPDLPGVYIVEAASRTQHVTRKIIL